MSVYYMARRRGSLCEHLHMLSHTYCTHTAEPTRAPHVTLTQFRSVAQSRAGIQNKKTVTFKNRLTFFSSHWWDPHNGSIHLLCQRHLQLIILLHLRHLQVLVLVLLSLLEPKGLNYVSKSRSNTAIGTVRLLKDIMVGFTSTDGEMPCV